MGEKMTIVEIKDDALLSKFMYMSGDLGAFRYFDKRPFSVIKEHLVTLIGMDEDPKYEGDPICYGHLNAEGWLGICVSEFYRGEGLGKQMMSELIRHGKEKGLKEIKLIVDTDNAVARAMYEKFGFVEFGAKGVGTLYSLRLQ
jgi:RimJ/RimL family protein N-acetyltransferase